MAAPDATIREIEVASYRVPTSAPESDGTLAWNSTTMVAVWVRAGAAEGFGFSYTGRGAAAVIQDQFAEQLRGGDALDVPGLWDMMARQARNLGFPGIAASAIAAVDTALWDLKAKLLDLPLAKLFGLAQDRVPLYGSGGFTSYSVDELQEQLAGWAGDGIGMVKMKVGTDPGADPGRVEAARAAVGPGVELFVDANGAYDAAQALDMAHRFAEQGVTWFEEPVSSDHLADLRLLRERGPPGMEIAAGEYGYERFYFRRMLAAGAVDVLQIDATRCGGYTGFLQAAEIARAHGVPISAHTAPALHLPVCIGLADCRHIEYFHDHVRIESMLMDGVPAPTGGALAPDLTRPGHGLSLKRRDAERYAV